MRTTLGVLLLLVAACERHGASAAATASARPGPAPHPQPAPVKSGITPFPVDPEAEPPLDQGPASDSASASERQERLVELLRGQTPAEKLPLAPTDPERALDSEQFRNLTTEVAVGSKLLGRRGGASVGQHRVLSGDLEGQALPRVLAGMRPAFRNCYNKALQLEPKLAGEMLLRVEVDRSGALSTASVVKSPPHSLELKKCVLARVKAGQLAPLVRGDSAAFELPITFVIEGGE